ncbi:MAG: hypothetical protein HYU68_00470 [Bacteroidetes bacterium]|nr:hypothetical protein [Bacteroidota bacterium]
MKSKRIILIITLFLSIWAFSGYAQTTISNGKSQLVEFNSTTSKFTVPAGKTWYIYNIFCERKYVQGEEEKDSKIILKGINGIVFKNGPLVYYYNTGLVLNFPLVFTEKTTFEFEIMENIGNKAVMTYIEVDN